MHWLLNYFVYIAEPGVVEGDLVTETDMSVITAEVVGGLPPPTSYMWTEQLDNGTFISYPAGQGWSSAVVSNTVQCSVEALLTLLDRFKTYTQMHALYIYTQITNIKCFGKVTPNYRNELIF